MGKNKIFISGNEAVAMGVRLARPEVIAAYPITPQTIVVERLSEMYEDGSLKTEYMHVESEHSALSAMIGASAVGARTFTATSSQGLLYMAECLHYASGGRAPIVMMNANRSVALPWSIYGDQRDSLSLLDSGWIQVYVEDAQESLDMIIQAYLIAEDKKVLLPVMVNLDGFAVTHTYEEVELPLQNDVDEFLPPFETPHKLDFDNPKNMGFSSTPQDNMEFKYQQNEATLAAVQVIKEVNKKFAEKFGRDYGGLIEDYRCGDAEVIIVTLGSITGVVKDTADELREEGVRAGVLKIRFMRPFPEEEIVEVLKNAKAIAVLEKDISFGYEGTVFTNTASAVAKSGKTFKLLNYIAGLGGRDVSKKDIRKIYEELIEAVKGKAVKRVQFVNLGVETDG